MNSILWSQSNSATSKDIYVINGVVSLDEQTNEQMSASNKLFECHEWGMFHKNSIQALKKNGKLLNNTFVSYKKGEGFYLSSNYTNQDVVGRLIAFQFFCSTDDFVLAMDEFVRVSKLIDREYSTAELTVLKDAILNPEEDISGSSSRGRSKLWIYLLGAATMLFIIAKSCSK